MPKIDLTETGLFYEEAGRGEPLVLIPGFASGAWSWNWQISELSKQFRVLTFDPRGVSRSTIALGAVSSIDKIADDVAELLDHLGLDSANILGISFGGFVAQEFALKHARLLNKLVLVSTGFGGPNHVLPAPEVLASFAATAGLNSPERIAKYLQTAFSPGFSDENADQVELFCRLREDNPVSEEVYRQQLGSAMVFNTEDRIGRISSDTLVITGDADTIVVPENSINLAERIPRAKLEVIDGAGHMAFVENAAQFNQLVLNFLNS